MDRLGAQTQRGQTVRTTTLELRPAAERGCGVSDEERRGSDVGDEPRSDGPSLGALDGEGGQEARNTVVHGTVWSKQHSFNGRRS
jgi:hypothetical protein